MNKRKYRNNLDFIEEGFRACWKNSTDLVESAKLLLDNGFHGQALSLSVLALEELGKLFCIDGLLYARNDDHKAEAYAKSLKSHSTKLSALTLFPLLLGHISSADPRFGSDKQFHQAIACCISDLKDRENSIFALLKADSFAALDSLKQHGFYAQPVKGKFQAPNVTIEKELSDAVYLFAWRATTTLDFLLKDGNLERYISKARSLRSKMTEKEHRTTEELANQLVGVLFPMQEAENAGSL